MKIQTRPKGVRELEDQCYLEEKHPPSDTPTLDRSCQQLTVNHFRVDSIGVIMLKFQLLRTLIEMVDPDHPSWGVKDQDTTRSHIATAISEYTERSFS